jgi:LysM repeat protein
MFGKLVMVLALAAVLLTVVVRPSTGAGPGETYVVRPADTLWSIAAAHYAGDPREGVWKLQRENHLRGALVHPGERLVLPP